MTQINQKVNDFIQKNITIQKALEDDIISLRKLAKHILLQLDLNISNLDAIISAIRRYDTKQSSQNYKIAKNIIKNTKITSKSDIVAIAIEKDDSTYQILPQLFKQINYNKGEVLRIIQAEESIKIIIDKTNFEKITKIIDSKKIITIEKDLSEINLHLEDIATKTPGIISTIFTQLMINDINVMETMSCVPEMILFVKEKDLLKCYSVLFNLIKE